MAEKQRFLFKIDGFTPDTLPMARLAEYLTDLAALLGEKERVHFKEVKDGSAALAYDVESVAVPKVKERVRRARIADADSEERKAFENIDHRLRKDNTPASLVEDSPNGATILFFPAQRGKSNPCLARSTNRPRCKAESSTLAGSATSLTSTFRTARTFTIATHLAKLPCNSRH